MKTIALILLMSVALAVSAQTTPPKHKKQNNAGANTNAVSSVAGTQTNQDLCCRYPLRVFGGNATVNLSPLFAWWSHHVVDEQAAVDTGVTNSRPLAAWHRITGNKVSQLEYSWVVDAKIYINPGVVTNARIILKNPPATEEQNYYTLKSELAAAVLQMTNDQRAYLADTRAAEKVQGRAQNAEYTRRGRLQENANAQRAGQEQQAATAAMNDQNQLQQAVAQAQKQLIAIPSQNGQYKVDLFALALGKSKDGVLIYDMGVVGYTSP